MPPGRAKQSRRCCAEPDIQNQTTASQRINVMISAKALGSSRRLRLSRPNAAVRPGDKVGAHHSKSRHSAHLKPGSPSGLIPAASSEAYASRVLLKNIGFLHRGLDVFKQMPTGVLGLRPQRPHVPIQRMLPVASARMLRLLVSRVFLAELNISPRASDVMMTKRLPTNLTTLLVSSRSPERAPFSC